MKKLLALAAARTYGCVRRLCKAAIANCLLAAMAAGAAAQTVNVAALGDSLVHGFGLPAEDGFVPQLQAWLDSNGGDALVSNAGVSGDTTAGGLARLEWTLASNPDALIVVLGGNDLLRGIQPAHSRENLDGILSFAAGRGVPVLLTGHEAPSNYGPEYKAEFEAMFEELSERHGALLYPRFFAALDAKGDRREVRRLYMQDDGIHPNREGVAVIVKSIGPMVLELAARARSN